MPRLLRLAIVALTGALGVILVRRRRTAKPGPAVTAAAAPKQAPAPRPNDPLTQIEADVAASEKKA